jgi:hypothetical protein
MLFGFVSWRIQILLFRLRWLPFSIGLFSASERDVEAFESSRQSLASKTDKFQACVDCASETFNPPEPKVYWLLSLGEARTLRGCLAVYREAIQEKLEAGVSQLYFTNEQTANNFLHIGNSLRQFNPKLPETKVEMERDTDRGLWILAPNEIDALCVGNEFPYEFCPLKADWPAFLDDLDRLRVKFPAHLVTSEVSETSESEVQA